MGEMAAAGLATAAGEPVPLRGVAIHVAGRGPAARVTVAQSYVNDEAQPVEAVYTFPLPEEAAVAGFQVEIHGQVLTGRVEEREKCVEDYDAALSRGAGAFMLDQDRPNVFTAYVGNLKPQEEVVLRLTYVTPLTWGPEGLRVAVPTVVSPRYLPPEHVRTLDPAELFHLTPPAVLGPLPYGFTLTLDLTLPGRVAAVECPSHPFRFELADGHLKGAVAGVARMDQDFVLQVRVEGGHEPFCLAAREPDGATVLMVGLNPEFPKSNPRSPLEVIFLVDCSGSMAGESAAQARNALDLCLRALELGDTFNIIAFGSDYQALFPEARPFGEDTLAQANRLVPTLDGHLGGTEVLAPLQAVLAQPPAPGRLREIILLTDGQVGNEAEILTLAKRHRGQAAIYPVGLGRGPNAHFIRSLARVSGGVATLVHPGERLEPVMVRLLEKLATPALNPVEVDWDGLTPELQTPQNLPPLHQGEPLLVLARFAGPAPGRVTVRAGGHTWELMPAAAGEDDVLSLLLAREALRELEDRLLGGRWALSPQEERELKAQILSLSRRYGLLSSLTSFLVVAERPGEEAGDIVMRRIPVALTQGWGGREWVSRSTVKKPRIVYCKLLDVSEKPSAFYEFSHIPVREKKLPTGVDQDEQDFRCLIRAQRVSGFWQLPPWLAQLAGISINKVRKLARQLPLPREEAEQLLATLLAWYLLHTRFQKWQAEWALVAAKAERWLERHNLTPPPPGSEVLPWLIEALAGLLSFSVQ
ncbi:MAG: VIT domain-containing protein [Desulfobaccales bacterium]